MHGWTVILHLLIYLFYLNIISLTSPNITLALLFDTSFFEFHFYLEKTGPTKTRAAGPFPPTLHFIYHKDVVLFITRINVFVGLFPIYCHSCRCHSAGISLYQTEHHLVWLQSAGYWSLLLNVVTLSQKISTVFRSVNPSWIVHIDKRSQFKYIMNS